jgi:outer membrane protein TolC
MERPVRTPISRWLLLLTAVPAGCAALDGTSATPPAAPTSAAAAPFSGLPVLVAAPLRQASFEVPVQGHPPVCASDPGGPPFAGAGELSVEALVEQVLARNPSLAQMTAAWQAASARYPQVTSLDDPMFGATFAPASIGSDNVEFGYRLEVSQRLPFPGKLGLRGQSALAEASAAGREVEDTRLQLVESARNGFYEYFLVVRALAVNEENLRLLRTFREEAKARYERGLVPEQDVFQADVELGRQQERGLTLERMRKVAVARLNTLMHLPPETPLPPPPERLTLAEAPPPVEVLRGLALNRRPDLRALADRLRAEEASLGLAYKEFCPDFEVTAAYDTIMGNGPTRDLAPQLGVRLNLPVRRARREGAVAEAQARVAQRRAELDGRVDQVNLQLQEAYEQVVESERAVRLYEQSILPAARSNVEAARSAYETAKVPFLSLVEAQRSRVMLLDRSYEALADYFRRRAALERVAGGSLALPSAPPGPGLPGGPPRCSPSAPQPDGPAGGGRPLP